MSYVYIFVTMIRHTRQVTGTYMRQGLGRFLLNRLPCLILTSHQRIMPCEKATNGQENEDFKSVTSYSSCHSVMLLVVACFC